MDRNFFHDNGLAYPDLCFVASVAVGFPVSIFWLREPGEKTLYQVMTEGFRRLVRGVVAAVARGATVTLEDAAPEVSVSVPSPI